MRTVTYYTLAGFAATLALALTAGFAFTMAGVSVVDQPDNLFNAVYFFAYILGAALAVILILKYYKGKRLFYLVELLVNFTAVQLLASLIFSDIVAVITGIIAVVVRIVIPWTKNLWLFITTAVIGGLLGASLGVLPAAVLGILLSAYDYYAVFISKHMVQMAVQLEQRQAAFAVALQYQKETLHLGTGDLVVPGMLAVSALKLGPYPFGFAAALATAAGCLVGLGVLVYHLEKRRGYWPALPPIVGFGLAGLIAFLLLPL